ncbi:MAG TPA: HAD-IC family P-type ATPase [Candidatus Binataceae bacterium]|nr:HAD-IC family P-type ATPase [Candidatus Binataceae bacterium]
MKSPGTLSADSAGLSTVEATRRLAQTGPNEIGEEHESILKRIARHFWAPVPWMLEATIVLQIALGKHIEAMMIGALLLFNVGLSLFQESRAEAALALLKQHLSLKAKVKRDGRWVELPAADLVPGDIVQLSLGVVVPGDARIIEGSVLLDQSMLTGESIPVDAGLGKTAYAGALVRRGEAIASVTATGTSTYFGRAAELVRIARVESTETKVVVSLVRNLSTINVALVLGLVAYATRIGLPVGQIIPLVLTALLSAVPVALPATFTLGAALGARTLALKGVLLTRLAALHEAAMIDVLCVDKTGTLTKNELAVAAVRPLANGWTVGDVLAFAALTSSPEGQDPVDAAIRAAALATPSQRSLPVVTGFTPFDPAYKRSEAIARDEGQNEIRISKGAPSVLELLAPMTPAIVAEVEALSGSGYRTLGVVIGCPGRMAFIGLVALNDPPRPDSAALLAELRHLGVSTVMVTGDAALTAATIAHSIGLDGAVCPSGQIPERANPDDFAVYAGIFPEEKFRLVKAFQRNGHAVGMCGDGANDAPALRQAQMGIAVSTATDVAKAAAGIVLTDPGLGGIVTAIKEGRAVFRRVLTYTLGILVNKCVTLVVLGAGLVLTRQAVLTPMLQAMSMLTNDFVSMARTADRATPSPRPNTWQMGNLVSLAVPLAAFKFMFCIGILAAGWFWLGLSVGQMQTLTFIMLVFAGQAVVYVVRERDRMWGSCPVLPMMLFSLADIAIVSALALSGTLMRPLPLRVVISLLVATTAFAFALDQVKVMVLARRPID